MYINGENTITVCPVTTHNSNSNHGLSEQGFVSQYEHLQPLQ